ncbi:MAG: chromosomal replication initiator protein DnaA [Planctomycetota bacterium]|jgi:chromosomal replication initiator protein|nr:chromosomal replication initiator protein DnaA [Planctomycetota bacterium]MDP6937387.1 chromosomal replication initiator protein DnaA [Planctomycetota bacterium]
MPPPDSTAVGASLDAPAHDVGTQKSPRDAEECWARVQEALRARIVPEQFDTWFLQARLLVVDEPETGLEVSLAVLNSYTCDWISKYYRPAVESAVHSVLGQKCRVRIAVDPEATVPPAPAPSESGPPLDSSPSTGTPGGVPPGAGPALAPGAGLLWNSDVVLNHKYTFENFVVGPCNRFAHAAAVGSGERPGKNYNPFFLHGRVGVGKTHLLQALCFSILERDPSARILYLSCETFVNHFISALENGDLDEFRTKYRNVDVLVVDDIHILANKERTQEEFFHTFNTLYQAGKQLVLSSDSPPKDIPTLQERLVSRFRWGMVTEIEPPCYETRMAIVKRKSRDQGRELPDAVAQLIAEQIDQNVRELEGAVTRLLGFSSLTGKPLTLELAREALGDLLQANHGTPTMDDIISAVTCKYGVKLSELQSRRRTKSITHPRQVAMFLARRITRHSLEEVGGFFGGRDHSTVIYAVDRVSKALRSDPEVREQVEGLLGRLGAPSDGRL